MLQGLKDPEFHNAAVLCSPESTNMSSIEVNRLVILYLSITTIPDKTFAPVRASLSL